MIVFSDLPPIDFNQVSQESTNFVVIIDIFVTLTNVLLFFQKPEQKRLITLYLGQKRI